MPAAQSRPSALVTGASTGIGHAAVAELVRRGWHAFAAVRKAADANRLREEFKADVTPLIMDVTDQDAIDAAVETVRAALDGQTLRGLVNNAGIAVGGPLIYTPIEDYQRQFDVNVIGQVRVTQAFAPLLGVDETLTGKPGRIVMISSVAGEMGAPFFSPYAASKHALEGLSKSLRRELMPWGIEVVVIGPGAVKTPIWGKSDGGEIARQFADTAYGEPIKVVQAFIDQANETGLPASKIARRIFKALTDPKPRFRYAIVPKRLTNWTLPQILPERMVDNIVAKRIGLRPEDHRKT